MRNENLVSHLHFLLKSTCLNPVMWLSNDRPCFCRTNQLWRERTRARARWTPLHDKSKREVFRPLSSSSVQTPGSACSSVLGLATCGFLLLRACPFSSLGESPGTHGRLRERWAILVLSFFTGKRSSEEEQILGADGLGSSLLPLCISLGTLADD